jgi:hypothetical protein
VADGFSCREQIAQGTRRRALHLAQVLHMAIRDCARASPRISRSAGTSSTTRRPPCTGGRSQAPRCWQARPRCSYGRPAGQRLTDPQRAAEGVAPRLRPRRSRGGNSCRHRSGRTGVHVQRNGRQARDIPRDRRDFVALTVGSPASPRALVVRTGSL